MDEEEAREVLDKVINGLDEAFGDDCLTIVICLTNGQTRTRYCSNMERQDAAELMTDLMESFDSESHQERKHLN